METKIKSIKRSWWVRLKMFLDGAAVKDGIVSHPKHGIYLETVSFKQGMTILPYQRAEFFIKVNKDSIELVDDPRLSPS